MCYDADARPPLPPIRGAAADAGEVTLTSADGTSVAGYAARAAAQGGAGIVILPDVRGLHPFYRDLAMRSAEAGMHAVAIDYFGRTAGLGARNEDFDHMAHVRQTTPDGVAQTSPPRRSVCGPRRLRRGCTRRGSASADGSPSTRLPGRRASTA